VTKKPEPRNYIATPPFFTTSDKVALLYVVVALCTCGLAVMRCR
jgi:hypothetical protein